MRAMENTDARYLEVSREMHASSDWLVPRLAGRMHLDKPPLTYWAASLGYAVLGETPFAGRLFQQLALACTALVVGLGGRRWLGRKAAFDAALVLLSSGLVFATSRILVTDLFQLLFFTGAMLAFLRGVEAPGRPGAVVLAFALLGASANAKGPIALFVAAPIWLPFLWLTRGQTRISGRSLALGLVLFLALGAPWYLVLWGRDPDILSHWIRVQLLARLTGSQPDLGHSHGPFYLLGSWPLALLPWTPLAGLALWRLRPSKGWRRADPLDLYLLLWATVPVLLFSIPRTKIATYLLPALPGAALAISRALETGRLADRTGRRALVASVALASGLALAFVAAALWPAWIRSNRFEPALVVAGPAFACALAAAALLTPLALTRLSRGPGASAPAIRGTALATGMIFVLGYNVLAPGFASWREEGLLARSVPGAWLLAFGVDRVSALYYFGDVDHYLFAHGRTEQQRQSQRDDDAPGASPEAGLTLLRGGQPVFCLTKEKFSAALIEASGAVILHRRLNTVLLANPAAQRALAAQGEARPL
jgi:4-amino-4-deoxy-L-arabinose transferase-like glycosyltransferase